MTTEGRTSNSVIRAFNWGLLIIGDPQAPDVPDLSADSGINQSSSLIVVPVRHAQDVALEAGPFEVEVRYGKRTSGFTNAAHHALVRLPTGDMGIGDADDEVLVSLEPGWWWISTSLTPANHAEVVEIQLSRAAQCPVCTWPGLMEEGWKDGNPSDEICPSCGTQFGYDDAAGFTSPTAHSHRLNELRRTWLDGGMAWWSESRPAPAEWRPDVQD